MRWLLALLVLLAACADQQEEVPWDTYAPQVKANVDGAVTSHDCGWLQEQFDDAEAGSDAHRAATGVGNSALMAYIGDRMTDLGC